jgi:hypothetical protein
MTKQGTIGATSVNGRVRLGMIVLANVLAVPVTLVMAMITLVCAASIRAGGRLLDPKDPHNTAIGLITAVLLPFALHLIYFMNFGRTARQADRAALSLLTIVAVYLAYAVYTAYGLYALNDMWLVSGDDPGSLSGALVPLFFCGCLSFGTILRRRSITALESENT